MADKKVSELIALNTLSGDDLLLVVNDPAGTPSSRKISVGNVFGNVAVETTHRKKVTFAANVAINANTTITADTVAVTGDLTVNGYSVLTELDAKISSTVAEKLFVSNSAFVSYVAVDAPANYANKNNSILTGNTTAVNFSSNTVTVRANTGLVVAVSTSPSSNNPATEGWGAGTIAFSNTHLYIAVDGNSIKRVPLEVF